MEDEQIIQVDFAITSRVRAMLTDVAAGRGVFICGCEPDLEIDGCPVCDQFTVHLLTHAGMLRPSEDGQVGEHVSAVITPIGRYALEHGTVEVSLSFDERSV